MISREISIDIIQYLQTKKKMSVEEIAESMGTSPKYIQDIISRKTPLKAKYLDFYIKNANIKFWEFAIEAISMNHLSKKSRDRILLCKKISDNIKKKT